jgi:hypothetical protein
MGRVQRTKSVRASLAGFCLSLLCAGALARVLVIRNDVVTNATLGIQPGCSLPLAAPS